MGIKLDYPTYLHRITAGITAYAGHTGVDFSVPIGTLVYAPADGKVIGIEEFKGYEPRRKIYGKMGKSVQDGYRSYGRLLTISHGNGIVTKYAHLSSFDVKKGQSVKKGDVIAHTGNAGNCQSNSGDGAHLHFEVRLNGSVQDPVKYFSGQGPTGGRGTGQSGQTAGNKTEITVTYTKWKGYGYIKKDWIPLLWYQNNSTTPTDWGFRGFAGERVDYIGKIGKQYYYGKVRGLCQSYIVCVIPVNQVVNKTGRPSGGTGKILIGYSGSDEGSTKGSTIILPKIFNGHKLGLYPTYEFTVKGYSTGNFAYGLKEVRDKWKSLGSKTTKGCASIDGKIIIACTSTFGTTKDWVTFYFSNNKKLDCIIGDEKSQQMVAWDNDPANKWGHDDGRNIIEVCGCNIGNTLYDKFGLKGPIVKAVKHGKYKAFK